MRPGEFAFIVSNSLGYLTNTTSHLIRSSCLAGTRLRAVTICRDSEDHCWAEREASIIDTARYVEAPHPDTSIDWMTTSRT